MIDPERIVPTPPLFAQTSSAGAQNAPIAEKPDAARVSSGRCSFLPPNGVRMDLPEPAADRLIVGKPAHKRMVMDLQKKFSNQLGFLPGVAIDWYLENQHVGIACENGEPCGYVLGRPSFRYQRLMRPITQAAVFMDAQRRRHGLALIEGICRRAAAAGQQAVQASCAIDIEAVDFWLAAGFFPIHTHAPENARGREIIVMRRCLIEQIPAWFQTPPPYAGHRAKKAEKTGGRGDSPGGKPL